ncbi:hypothetical protein GA0115254_11555 [Streptomyces sp. Ncost-T10-10d]|nr:hypothetical protein GA0115254_11555 [Streptomyces sp. Ncost-T10-10d]
MPAEPIRLPCDGHPGRKFTRCSRQAGGSTDRPSLADQSRVAWSPRWMSPRSAPGRCTGTTCVGRLSVTAAVRSARRRRTPKRKPVSCQATDGPRTGRSWSGGGGGGHRAAAAGPVWGGPWRAPVVRIRLRSLASGADGPRWRHAQEGTGTGGPCTAPCDQPRFQRRHHRRARPRRPAAHGGRRAGDRRAPKGDGGGRAGRPDRRPVQRPPGRACRAEVAGDRMLQLRG